MWEAASARFMGDYLFSFSIYRFTHTYTHTHTRTHMFLHQQVQLLILVVFRLPVSKPLRGLAVIEDGFLEALTTYLTPLLKAI